MTNAAEPTVAKIDPGPTEDQKTFMARCMHEETKFSDLKQRVAVCMSKWNRKAPAKNAAGAGCPDPQDSEDRQTYLDRCSADHPEADCRAMWDKMQGGGNMPADNAAHLLSVFTIAQAIPIRREKLDGVEHIVLPLIALVTGVYQCSNCSGPNYYPEAEFGKNAQAWNGRPVTYGHPMRGDSYVSAGSPDVWGKERIGTTFHARIEDGKLHMEAWLDPAALKRAGSAAQAVLATAEAGGRVEVSTAAWIDEVPRVGSHNGKSYSVAQTNFQPDHLALLPLDQTGACNWADGCGVRVASADDVPPAEPKAQCCDACAKGEPCAAEVTIDAFTAEIQETVDALTAAIETLTGHGFTVTFEEETAMADDPKQAAETTPSDTPKQLDLPVQGEPKAQTGLSAEQRRIAELEAKVEHLTAQAAKKPQVQTVEEYIDQAPAAMRESLLQLHKAAERRRLELVDKVRQAPGCMFSQEQLDAMQEKDLLPLVALIARTDFSIQPPVNSKFAGDGDDFAELPPSVWAPRDPHKPAS